MSDGVAPSKGAMIAAYDILSKFGMVHASWQNTCAEIIDRETKSPQMLDILRQLVLQEIPVTPNERARLFNLRAEAERLLSELEVKP